MLAAFFDNVWSLHGGIRFWTIFGLTGNVMFTSRFVVQWYASEKLKQSVIPKNFWHLSFLGGLINLVYALHIGAIPFVLGALLPPDHRRAQPHAHRAAPAHASRGRPGRRPLARRRQRRADRRRARPVRPRTFPGDRCRSRNARPSADRCVETAMKSLALLCACAGPAAPRRMRGAAEGRSGGHRSVGTMVPAHGPGRVLRQRGDGTVACTSSAFTSPAEGADSPAPGVSRNDPAYRVSRTWFVLPDNSSPRRHERFEASAREFARRYNPLVLAYLRQHPTAK